MKLTLQKLEGLPYGENCTILTWAGYEWSTRVTDWQTDGRAIALCCAKHIMLSRAKNASECTKMHQCENNFQKNSGRGHWPGPPQTPSCRTCGVTCPFCPTHFLVPSGAYASDTYTWVRLTTPESTKMLRSWTEKTGTEETGATVVGQMIRVAVVSRCCRWPDEHHRSCVLRIIKLQPIRPNPTSNVFDTPR